jgi:hypothetical protein
MTTDTIHDMIKNLDERIHVLESERVTEKYIQPFYNERSELLKIIESSEGVK